MQSSAHRQTQRYGLPAVVHGPATDASDCNPHSVVISIAADGVRACRSTGWRNHPRIFNGRLRQTILACHKPMGSKLIMRCFRPLVTPPHRTAWERVEKCGGWIRWRDIVFLLLTGRKVHVGHERANFQSSDGVFVIVFSVLTSEYELLIQCLT